MSQLSASVLVLGKTWQPLKVTSVKRALILMCKGIAEAIDVEQTANGTKYVNYDFENWCELSEFREQFESDRYNWIHAVNLVVPVPTVIRLLDYAQYRARPPRLSRKNIYARDANQCQYCGKYFSTDELNIDHVIPKSQGGTTCWTNVVCSCVRCNTKKGSRTPEQAKMPLIRPAKKPLNDFRLPTIKHWSWSHFVDAAYYNVELKD